jgi:Tol biopolymer transport system component
LYPNSTTDNSDIWIYNAADGRRTRFTFDPALDTNPVWSPDGRSIIFGSRRKGHLDLYRKSSDGAGAEELLYSDDLDKYPTSWSPNGNFLLYRGIGARVAVSNVWVLPLTPERPGAPLKPFPFAPLPFSAGNGQFSPDGAWIAYASLESQRYAVYVARFPGAGGKRQISVAGGITPRWRRDGKEIFYMTPDGTIMSAAVTTKGDALEVGQVRRLFGPLNIAGSSFRFDVAPDGQRFLIVPPPQASREGVTLIQNWIAGLKK